MTFLVLRDAADRLRRSVGDACGRDLILTVSVDEPTSDDELGFYKLVLWSYVFWIEACSPAGRHILDILRNASPAEYKSASATFNFLLSLRTRLAHNLGTSTGDRHKLTQASIWLEQNGGEPTNWTRCIESLSAAMTEALISLSNQWELLLASPEDAESAVERLLFAVDHDWPVHTFDPIISEVAASLDLEGLDVVTFRQARHDEWRKLAKMFHTRADADAAVRRIILSEMTRTFGASEGGMGETPQL